MYTSVSAFYPKHMYIPAGLLACSFVLPSHPCYFRDSGIGCTFINFLTMNELTVAGTAPDLNGIPF